MKLKDLLEQYGEQEVLCLSERTDESLEWLNIGLKPSKQKTVWDLEKGENYLCITETGEVLLCENRTIYLYEKKREIGNVFLEGQQKEAEKECERRKIETLLLKNGGRRWFKNGKENWFITFDRSVGFFRYVYTIRDQRQGTIYFDTEEQARQAVKDIGENRIEQTLFEVR